MGTIVNLRLLSLHGGSLSFEIFQWFFFKMLAKKYLFISCNEWICQDEIRDMLNCCFDLIWFDLNMKKQTCNKYVTLLFNIRIVNIIPWNRIYREELKASLGMNFFSPFQPEREFKVYKSCKCSQIICSRVL